MNISKIIDTAAQTFYLDYVNNYLTVAKIAEHNGINETLASELIEHGRAVNERDSAFKRAERAN